MLSILIPTYNYSILSLAFTLKEQAKLAGIVFEIICLDDASQSFISENQKINQLECCSFEVLSKNIGRSAIRNLLATKAKYDHLLFLDADTIPIHDSFVLNYVDNINEHEKIVYGGIRYQDQKPEKAALLRWVYGKSREALSVENRNKNKYLTFLTLNFLISKSVFKKVIFNENILNYGHEDTLFSFNLMQQNIKMQHIENPVYHLGLESSSIFIKKSEDAIQNLSYLIDHKLIDYQYVSLYKTYNKLKNFNLICIYIYFYKIFKPNMVSNLKSTAPSLFVFDLYRLGYLCSLKSN